MDTIFMNSENGKRLLKLTNELGLEQAKRLLPYQVLALIKHGKKT